jgi:hypothetical protein
MRVTSIDKHQNPIRIGDGLRIIPQRKIDSRTWAQVKSHSLRKTRRL